MVEADKALVERLKVLCLSEAKEAAARIEAMVDEIEALRKGLVEAVIPLEALQLTHSTFNELSPEMRHQIGVSTAVIKALLKGTPAADTILSRLQPSGDGEPSYAKAIEDAARVAENTEIFLPLAAGLPDGAQTARRLIVAAIRALAGKDAHD